MAYKLLDSLSERWRVNGHELVAEVLDGARFEDKVEEEAEAQGEAAAA